MFHIISALLIVSSGITAIVGAMFGSGNAILIATAGLVLAGIFEMAAIPPRR